MRSRRGFDVSRARFGALLCALDDRPVLNVASPIRARVSGQTNGGRQRVLSTFA